MTTLKALILVLALTLVAGCSPTMMSVGPDAPGYCLPNPKMKKMSKDPYC